MELSVPIASLILYVSLIVAMVFHEAAHALVAKWGGDPTAYEHGQVTLNPIPHMRREPFGTIVLPFIGLFLLGFPLGFAHAPYNPAWADRHPRRSALMALAGPGSNFLLAVVIVGILAAGFQAGFFELPVARSDFGLGNSPVHGWMKLSQVMVGPDGARSGAEASIALILGCILLLNVLLCVFNLIPLPPLDGAAVLEGFLPGPIGGFFRFLRSNPMFSIVGLIIVIQVIPYVFWPVWFGLMELLHTFSR